MGIFQWYIPPNYHRRYDSGDVPMGRHSSKTPQLATPDDASPRLGRVPHGYPATWLIAGAAMAGVAE